MIKRPKFKLELTINELTNIPQVNGYCYIEMQIRDNKRSSLRGLLKGNHRSVRDGSPSNGNDGPSNKSFQGIKGGSDGGKHTNSSGLLNSSNTVMASTSHKKIYNFKCNFGYSLTCNLKFDLKKKDNLIGDKYLLMKVFYITEKPGEHSNSQSHNSHHQQRLELGTLDINLTEYLNFTEPFSSKYLLKKSKVNSILNLTVNLIELPADFEFKTQVQVNDRTRTPTNDTKGVESKPSNFNLNHPSTTSSHYNIPQFEKKNVFGGLDDVIRSENSKNDQGSSDQDEENKLQQSNKSSGQGQGDYKTIGSSASTGFGGKHDEAVLIDPTINELYKKILESTWDPKLRNMLEFSPDYCISSIFENRGQEWMKKLRETLDVPVDDSDNIRSINGLVNETNYREDLRSWKFN